MRHCANRMCLSPADGHVMSLVLLSLSLCVALMAASVDAVPVRDSDEMYAKLDGVDEYGDVDNVEWHHLKIVNGLLEEDHPIIMYKEDFVSEDFDPSKNRSSEAGTLGGTSHGSRKFKNNGHRRRNRLHHTKNDSNNKIDDATSPVVTEKYRALKPKKMLFDVLPQSPLLGVATDDSSAVTDAKFDPSKIRVEVISLTDDNNRNEESLQIEGGDEVSKQMLSKHPKKYHRRTRRNAHSAATAGDGVMRQKRNPYYYHYPYFGQNLQSVNVVSVPRSDAHSKYSVLGKFWNALHVEVPTSMRTNSNTNTNANANTNMDFGPRFGGPNDTETVVWGGGNNVNQVTERPARRPRPSTLTDLFHDSNPANADTSFANSAARLTPQRAPPTAAVPLPQRKIQSRPRGQVNTQQQHVQDLDTPDFGRRFTADVNEERVVWNVPRTEDEIARTWS